MTSFGDAEAAVQRGGVGSRGKEAVAVEKAAFNAGLAGWRIAATHTLDIIKESEVARASIARLSCDGLTLNAWFLP